MSVSLGLCRSSSADTRLAREVHRHSPPNARASECANRDFFIKSSSSSFWSGLGLRRPPRQLVCSAPSHHPWNAARPVAGRRPHPQYWRCSSVSVPSDDLSSWLSPVRKQAGTGATVPFRKHAVRPAHKRPPRSAQPPGRRPVVGVGRLRVRGFPFVERCGVPLLPSIAARCSRTSRSRANSRSASEGTARLSAAARGST